MDRFRYEYFIVNIGTANFRGAGASLKKLLLIHNHQVPRIEFMAVAI